jgi:hypothetical protein
MFVFLVIMLRLLETAYGFFAHVLNLSDYSGAHLGLMRLFLSSLWLIYFTLSGFFTVGAFAGLRQLHLRIANSVFIHSKTSEQEGEKRVLKESLLGLFAVFVHGIPDSLELYIRTTDEFLDFLFLEMMR